jgi:hypothetical protein
VAQIVLKGRAVMSDSNKLQIIAILMLICGTLGLFLAMR